LVQCSGYHLGNPSARVCEATPRAGGGEGATVSGCHCGGERGRTDLDGRRQESAVAADCAETQGILSDEASDDWSDLVTVDAWEPERPSASESAFSRAFACRYVQDSANPRALPGGTPEDWDADLTATLVREAFEENQVRVGETAYLGY
jgi:hypothetical protein